MNKRTIKFLGVLGWIICTLSIIPGMQIVSTYIFESANRPSYEVILTIIILLLATAVFFFIHIALHEVGHLIFGLLTGYKFSSYRIGNFMWLRDGDAIRFRRLTITGTGGQCLMIPPDSADGDIPYRAYNLGGSIVNLIFGAPIFAVLLPLCRTAVHPAIICLMLFGNIGVTLALMNGLPMNMGGMDNDGMNAVSLGKNSAARRAFYTQMKANEQLSRGIRLKDMPDELFVMPSAAEMQNPLSAAIAVFIASRMIDAQSFTEADTLIAKILSGNNAVAGIHRNLLVCERVYCELISENRSQTIDAFLVPQQLKFMRAMRRFPSVIRTEYAIALLHKRDEARAAELLRQFDKVALTYPYPCDIESERELIAVAAAKR